MTVVLRLVALGYSWARLGTITFKTQTDPSYEVPPNANIKYMCHIACAQTEPSSGWSAFAASIKFDINPGGKDA